MCLPFLCGGDDPVRHQPPKTSELRPAATAARPAKEDANDSNGHKPATAHGGAVNGNSNGGAAPATSPASYPDTEVRATYGDKQSPPKEGAAGKPPTVVPAASHPQAPAEEAKKTHGGAVGRRNGISSPVLTAPPQMEAMAPPATLKDAPPPPAAANDVHGDADEQRRGYGDQGGAATGEDDRKPRRRSWL